MYSPFPLSATDFLETDMTDQMNPPKRPDSARAQADKKPITAQDEWKAQLDRLLDEYRHHYVLPPRPEENPRP